MRGYANVPLPPHTSITKTARGVAQANASHKAFEIAEPVFWLDLHDLVKRFTGVHYAGEEPMSEIG